MRRFGSHRRSISRRARPSGWWRRKIDRSFLLDLFAISLDTPERRWFTFETEGRYEIDTNAMKTFSPRRVQ